MTAVPESATGAVIATNRSLRRRGLATGTARAGDSSDHVVAAVSAKSPFGNAMGELASLTERLYASRTAPRLVVRSRMRHEPSPSGLGSARRNSS